MCLTKRLSLTLLLIFLAGNVFAQWKVNLNLNHPFIDNPDFINAMEDVVGRLEDFLNDILSEVPSNPRNLVQGFADASIFAGHGATQRAYGGYDFLAITTGFMLGLRIPGSFSIAMLDNPENMINSMGSNSFGLGIQGVNLEAGLHVSKFLPINRLYAAFRFGYINVNHDFDNFSVNFNNFQIGVLGRYQLVDDISLLLLKWRGITIGTGLVYQRTGLGFDILLGDGFTTGPGSYDLLINDPVVHFGMTMSTFTVPMEITSAVQLLFVINLGMGVGFDMAFGSNELDIGIKNRIFTVFENRYFGDASVEGGGSMGPIFLLPKLMANFGFKFGPVIIDFPMTYYFGRNHGFSLGITTGAVF